MVRLDIKKPFGEVFGHPKARYEQYGKLFDANQELIEFEMPVFKDIKHGVEVGEPTGKRKQKD